MNITIIGTSNSVLMNAYVEALSIDHTVTNLSAGRNSIFYHIKTLILNYDIIAQSDLLIVDHYINDINFYLHQNIKEYTYHVEQFYSMLKSLNVFSMVLFMPVYGLLQQKEKIDYVDFLKNKLDNLNISHLDLNVYNFKEHHFKDNVHILPNVSYLFGILLSEELSRNLKDILPIENGSLYENPYLLLKSRDMLIQNKEFELENFKNSLMSIEYIKIGIAQSIEINLDQKCDLLSFGYFLHKAGVNSAFTLLANDRKSDILCQGKYYFHETFNEAVSNVDRFEIHAFNKSNMIVKSMRESKVMNPTEFNLVDILLYNNNVNLKYESNNCKKIDIQLNTLNNLLDNVIVGKVNLFFSKTETRNYEDPLELLEAISAALEKSEYIITSKLIMRKQKMISDEINLNKCQNDANILREISLIFEQNNDIKTAYKLMIMALELRPVSPLIKQKCEEYKEKLRI